MMRSAIKGIKEHMFEISISAKRVEIQVEEILKRIAHAGEPSIKKILNTVLQKVEGSI